MRKDAGWWLPDAAPFTFSVRDAKMDQVDYVMKYVPRKRRVAVVAGAWNGLVPAAMSNYMASVVAFEPDCENYLCAVLNLVPHRNVSIHHTLLAERNGVAALANANDGLHYVATTDAEAANRVPALALDALCLDRVDLVWLDVEGYEHRVLEGAEGTIRRCGPTVIYEENALVSRYGRQRGDVARWLEERGYKHAGTWTTLPPEVQDDGEFRGSDLIYVRS